jgi:hypothetical protein
MYWKYAHFLCFPGQKGISADVICGKDDKGDVQKRGNVKEKAGIIDKTKVKRVK